jgi:hypothetical protein
MEETPKKKRTPAMIAAQKRYYQRHKEKCLERQRKWFAEHPDYRKNYNKAYRLIGTTPEELEAKKQERIAKKKARERKKYMKNLSYRQRKAREYYQAHREERLAYQKEYNKRKKEKEAC